MVNSLDAISLLVGCGVIEVDLSSCCFVSESGTTNSVELEIFSDTLPDEAPSRLVFLSINC